MSDYEFDTASLLRYTIKILSNIVEYCLTLRKKAALGNDFKNDHVQK